jgi:hypothetical protein
MTIIMSLTFDKDFDTTLVIIDNTWSKKCKQEQLDKYTKYAESRMKVEEAVGEIVQTLLVGTVQKTETKFGVVSGIVPHIKIGHTVGGAYSLQPSVWYVLHHQVTGINAAPFRNYVNYLKDPEYIAFAHKNKIRHMYNNCLPYAY